MSDIKTSVIETETYAFVFKSDISNTPTYTLVPAFNVDSYVVSRIPRNDEEGLILCIDDLIGEYQQVIDELKAEKNKLTNKTEIN